MYLLVDRNTRVESVLDINSLCNTLVACHVLNLYRPSEHAHVNEYVQIPPFMHPFVSFILGGLCMWRIADLSQFGDIRSKRDQHQNVTTMALSIILVCSVPYSEENLTRNMLLLRYTLFSICSLTWTYSVGITSLIIALYKETTKKDGIHQGHVIQDALLCQVRFCFILLVDIRQMIFFSFVGILMTIAKSYSIRGEHVPSTHPSYVIHSDNMPGVVLYVLNFMGNLMKKSTKRVSESTSYIDLEAPNSSSDASRGTTLPSFSHTSAREIPQSSQAVDIRASPPADTPEDRNGSDDDMDLHMMFKKQAMVVSEALSVKK